MFNRDCVVVLECVSRVRMFGRTCGWFVTLVMASCGTVVWAQTLGNTQYGLISSSEVPELLRAIAAIQEANFDAVSSFSGTYRFQAKYEFTAETADVLGASGAMEGSPPWRRMDQGTVALRYDEELGSTYSDFQVSDAKVVQDGSGKYLNIQLPYKSRELSVVSNAEYLSFRPTMKYGEFEGFADDVQRRGRAAIRADPDEGRRMRDSGVFYFEDLFSYGMPFWVYLRHLADAAEMLNKEKPASEIVNWFSVVRISGESASGESALGERVMVNFRLVPSADAAVADGIRLAITCSHNFGWNFRECTMSAPDGTEQQVHTWEFVEQDGIFIPGKIWRANLKSDGNSIATERLLVIDKAAVNEPLESSWFSWRAFNLEDGERLVDRVENVMYVVAPANCSSPVPETRWLRWAMLIHRHGDCCQCCC